MWQSRDHFDRFNADVVGPLMVELGGDGPPAPAPQVREFPVRGVVVPRGDLVV